LGHKNRVRCAIMPQTVEKQTCIFGRGRSSRMNTTYIDDEYIRSIQEGLKRILEELMKEEN